MMKAIGVATALVVLITVLWVQPGDSLKCYKCSMTVGGAAYGGGECRVPQSTTGYADCNSTNTCQTKLVTPGPSIFRDCGENNANTNPNGTCTTTLGVETCIYSCTGELCNIKAGAASISAMAVLTVTMSLIVASVFA
jgi:hypothetical protein